MKIERKVANKRVNWASVQKGEVVDHYFLGELEGGPYMKLDNEYAASLKDGVLVARSIMNEGNRTYTVLNARLVIDKE